LNSIVRNLEHGFATRRLTSYVCLRCIEFGMSLEAADCVNDLTRFRRPRSVPNIVCVEIACELQGTSLPLLKKRRPENQVCMQARHFLFEIASTCGTNSSKWPKLKARKMTEKGRDAEVCAKKKTHK